MRCLLLLVKTLLGSALVGDVAIIGVSLDVTSMASPLPSLSKIKKKMLRPSGKTADTR